MRSEILLRSVLFVAGDRRDAVEEASRSEADALVIDLAEPRTPFGENDRKVARAAIAEWITASAEAARPRAYVRVRPPSSGYMLRDLLDVCVEGLSGIVIPGVETPDDVVASDALVSNVERENSLDPGSLVMYPILETARSIRLAYEIAMASERVAHLGGAISRGGDLCEALGYVWTAEGSETHFLRSKVLVDSRAAGIRYPISGMWGGAPDDADGMRCFASETRRLGYHGMLIKDARHAPAVNEIFSPTRDQLDDWTAIDSAARSGVSVGGPTEYTAADGTRQRVKASYLGAARTGLEWARALGLAEEQS